MITQNKLNKYGFDDIIQYFIWIMEVIAYGEVPPTADELINQLNKGQKKELLIWLESEDERLIPHAVNECKQLLHQLY